MLLLFLCWDACTHFVFNRNCLNYFKNNSGNFSTEKKGIFPNIHFSFFWKILKDLQMGLLSVTNAWVRAYDFRTETYKDKSRELKYQSPKGGIQLFIIACERRKEEKNGEKKPSNISDSLSWAIGQLLWGESLMKHAVSCCLAPQHEPCFTLWSHSLPVPNTKKVHVFWTH